MPAAESILTVNCGSSSVKFAMFTAGPATGRLLRGEISGIGTGSARLRAEDARGEPLDDSPVPVGDHASAIQRLDDLLREHGNGTTPVGIGHRVVHGGPDCDCPRPVDGPLVERLRALVPLAPLHLPHNISGIVAMREHFPDVPQIACFDTAFHHGLPDIARRTGLPPELEADSVRRYGFHGLSYEYVLDALRRRHGERVLEERVIVAHLGNGASMAAISGGRSVETTMGFSALGGMPMGSRSGDLDPGIVLYLIGQRGLDPERVEDLLYRRSGLLGMSGLSADMRVLLAEREHSPQVDEAIRYFCHRARWYIGALSAVMGGLDRLVFTGGIGAQSSLIRAEICAGLDHLGIRVDDGRNAAPEPSIAASASRVALEAMPTDEETMIARHVKQALTEEGR